MTSRIQSPWVEAREKRKDAWEETPPTRIETLPPGTECRVLVGTHAGTLHSSPLGALDATDVRTECFSSGSRVKLVRASSPHLLEQSWSKCLISCVSGQCMFCSLKLSYSAIANIDRHCVRSRSPERRKRCHPKCREPILPRTAR